jgi:plastocyanin
MTLRRSAVLAVVALLAGLLASSSQAAPKMLVGTVGPGFTIKLTSGKYRLVIADKASIHDFVLEQQSGGKWERQLTSVPFVGTKTVTVTLKKGKWKYYCAPHESAMFGFFTVT